MSSFTAQESLQAGLTGEGSVAVLSSRSICLSEASHNFVRIWGQLYY